MPKKFTIHSDFSPTGDQPQAIAQLVEGLKTDQQDQVLLGVTGSGKTFTIANVIEQVQRPTLIMAHNKTLAAQLYNEMKAFFPENAVEYFVSYYDYYQPEAYVAKTDTFIEKDSSINEQIDRLRHSATRALLERKDVIVVASVSCIYGLGAPELYLQMTIALKQSMQIEIQDLTRQLVELQYTRNDIAFERGSFRVRGDTLDIFPSHLEDRAWRLSFFGEELESIEEFDTLTGEKTNKLEEITVFANSHHITPRPTLLQAAELIRHELKDRLNHFEQANKLLEAQRLQQRTQFDLEMLVEGGSCKGIENYSRYLSGRNTGEPPPTLFEYLPKNALLIMDESHVSVPQIGGMYNGDRARKEVLVEHGFRLPSALDNRPLKGEEWEKMRPNTIFVSATPSQYELDKTEGVIAQQVIRPTGLTDPPCIIRPVENQVDDMMAEARLCIAENRRILVTTLTKKMAEHLSEYLHDNGFKVAYLHSDVDTLDRIQIINDLRRGIYDILVGINLLREGIDVPECGLVAILDADKAGFLRSRTSLIQTIGRAARNVGGKAILYADHMTDALTHAIEETDRRRSIQEAYNIAHNITPKTIQKAILESLKQDEDGTKDAQLRYKNQPEATPQNIAQLKAKMLQHAENLEFEEAARLRDQLKHMEDALLGL